MSAGRGFTALCAVFVCAQSLTLAAVEPFTPYTMPPGQDPSVREAIDRAYYLSTTAVEQMRIAETQNTEGTQVVGEEPLDAGRLGRVPLWGRFEMAVVHRRDYADPFADVTCEVTFTRPDSTTFSFWGFYDEDNTWRIRALADQAGTWRYQVKFSDETGQFDGMFTCVASDLPGLIGVYKNNPIWFAQGDTPVLVRSLHVSDAFLSEEDAFEIEPCPSLYRAAFLDWVQTEGYNMLSVGDLTAGDDSLALWDADANGPDLAAYRRLETILSDLARRGISVALTCDAFAPASGVPMETSLQERHMRYTLARLDAYPNIVWIVGPIDTLGRTLRDMDPFGHLRCVANAAGDVPFEADWVTSSVLDVPSTVNLRRLSRVLRRSRDPNKPLCVQQSLRLGSRRRRSDSMDEERKSAYVMLMSGVTVDIADLGDGASSGFNATLDLEQKVQMRHDVVEKVWDFLEQVPYWWRMDPHPDLVDNGCCLAQPDRAYLVYLSEPGAVTVDLDEGMYRVAWINARDTSDVREAGIIEGSRRLTSPQEDDDWLLSLRRVEIVAGGIQPY